MGADASADPGLTRRALAVWGGPVAVVAGALAADAHQVPTPDALPEIVVSGTRRRAPAGVLLRADHLLPGEVTTVSGVRVTTPCRTAFDLARRLEVSDAVAAVDALAHRFRFRPEALRRLVVRHSGARHVERVRVVVALMDRRSESLPESRVRVALAVRGVPSPDLQVEVTTPAGRYRLDLAWRAQRVAVEYDGEDHRSIVRHGLDLERDAALADQGWLVIRVTARQLADPDALAARVRRLLAQRSVPPMR